VIAAGPAAYFSNLPIKAMLAALEREGIRCEVSQTAGTFVCNHVFYGLMHTLGTRPGFPGIRGGLIHVPWLPEQGQPSMPLDDIVRGLEVAIHCALTTGADIRKQAGALD
jgi:pyroglutamyl-peptidase